MFRFARKSENHAGTATQVWSEIARDPIQPKRRGSRATVCWHFLKFVCNKSYVGNDQIDWGGLRSVHRDEPSLFEGEQANSMAGFRSSSLRLA